MESGFKAPVRKGVGSIPVDTFFFDTYLSIPFLYILIYS